MAIKRMRGAKTNKTPQRLTNKFRQFLFFVKIYFKQRLSEALTTKTSSSPIMGLFAFAWCALFIFSLVAITVMTLFLGGFGHHGAASGFWIWEVDFVFLVLSLLGDMYYFQTSYKRHVYKATFQQVYKMAQTGDSKLNQLLEEQRKLQYDAAKAAQEWTNKIKKMDQDVDLRKREIKMEVQAQIKPLLNSRQAMNL